VTTAQDAPPKPRTFRSPFALVVWWLWVLFAIGNLIDLAVQGRDHLSVVAAFILLLVTGVIYVTAQRPRVLADTGGLTIVNPLRDHRVVWAAIVGIDPAELLRVRCEWPLPGAPAGAATAGLAAPGLDDAASAEGAASADGGSADAGPPTGHRAIYSWAVHSSRRRQVAARLRAERQSRRRAAGGRGFGAFGGYGAQDNPPPAPTAADAEHVLSELNALAEQAREAAPDQRAVPPVSRWYWPAFAAIIVPAIALVIAVLVLRGRIGGPLPQPFHVVGRRAGLDRRVDQDGHVPRGGQPALVGVKHVQPGEHVPVRVLLGLHPHLELAVEPEGYPVPAVKFLLVDLRDVVEHHEHPLRRVLDHRGERTVPADVLTAKSKAPALKPSGGPLRRVRAALKHLRRIHVAAVGGIECHAA
jgi:Bacterial PH domain